MTEKSAAVEWILTDNTGCNAVSECVQAAAFILSEEQARTSCRSKVSLN